MKNILDWVIYMVIYFNTNSLKGTIPGKSALTNVILSAQHLFKTGEGNRKIQAKILYKAEINSGLPLVNLEEWQNFCKKL